MGVPGLFSWVKRSCPGAVLPWGIDDKATTGCDNLYIDMNHILHGCTHGSHKCSSMEEPEIKKALYHVEEFVSRLVRLAAPRTMLFLAVDGVGPRAKMNQQRTRRFLAVYMRELCNQFEPDVRRAMDVEAKETLSIGNQPNFDQNIITPGTPFMETVSNFLQEMVQRKIKDDSNWRSLHVILSTAAEPGEGEHKIMRFIRHQRVLEGYNPNYHHMLFGQDADLILLSLLTHEPHFSIIREEMKPSESGVVDLAILDIGIVREYLQNEFKKTEELSGGEEFEDGSEGDGSDAPKKEAALETKESFNFERSLDDFVFLTFLLGNDFLPNLQSLDVYDRQGGLNIIMEAYREVQKKHVGYLVEEGAINPNKLRAVLQFLKNEEERAYQRQAFQKKNVMKKLAAQSKQEEPARGESWLEGGFISVGDLDADTSIDEVLGTLPDKSRSEVTGDALLNMSLEELQSELASRTRKRAEETLLSNRFVDPLKLDMPGYRDRYYKSLFGASTENLAEIVKKVCSEYLLGLSWVYAYYSCGNNPVASSPYSLVLDQEDSQASRKNNKGTEEPRGPLYATWDWLYPYYYAPLMQDLCENVHLKSKKQKHVLKPGSLPLTEYQGGQLKPEHGPVLPFIQLLSVLPPNSASACLPTKFADILLSMSAESFGAGQNIYKELLPMFPGNIPALVDSRGKMWAHTVVVKLPFADPVKMAQAVALPAPDDKELTEEEEERNMFGPALLFFHKDHQLATLLEALDDVEEESLAGQNSDEDKLEQPNFKSSGQLLLPLVIGEDLSDSVEGSAKTSATDGEEKDGEDYVLSAAIDIAGASTRPFVSELLPGVKIQKRALKHANKQLFPPIRMANGPTTEGRGCGRGRGLRGVSSRGQEGGEPRGRGRSFSLRGRGRDISGRSPSGRGNSNEGWGSRGSFGRRGSGREPAGMQTRGRFRGQDSRNFHQRGRQPVSHRGFDRGGRRMQSMTKPAAKESSQNRGDSVIVEAHKSVPGDVADSPATRDDHARARSPRRREWGLEEH